MWGYSKLKLFNAVLNAGCDIWSFGSNWMLCCRSRPQPAGGARGAASCQQSRGRSIRRRCVVLLHSLGAAAEGGGGAQDHCDLLLPAGCRSWRRSTSWEDDRTVWSSRSWEDTAVVRHTHTRIIMHNLFTCFHFHSLFHRRFHFQTEKSRFTRINSLMVFTWWQYRVDAKPNVKRYTPQPDEHTVKS